MSVGENAWNVLKSLVLYQETMRGIREDVAALTRDVAALGNAHADLRDRVSRLEGVIEGAAMATRRRRLEE